MEFKDDKLIGFSNQDEARKFLERLLDFAKEYGYITLHDLLDMAGIGANFRDDKVGWTYDRLQHSGVALCNCGGQLDIWAIYFSSWDIACLGEYGLRRNVLPHTRTDLALNQQIDEIISDFRKLVKKAKSYGLDIKLTPNSASSLELYFHDDYPNTILVDKEEIGM